MNSKVDNTIQIKLKGDHFNINAARLRALTYADSGTVRFNNGRWYWINFAQLAPYIDEWHITVGFCVEHEQDRNILTHLSEIKFPHLQQLSLKGNQIDSLEALSRIYLPNLKELILNLNRISSLQSMRKSQISALESFEVRFNKVNELDKIEEFNFKKLFKFLFDGDAQPIVRNYLKYRRPNSLYKLQSASQILKGEFPFDFGGKI